MDSRGHRAIRALAVFLVLALGVAALLPLIARGAFQVNGVISTCGGPTPFVSGTVTLIDANGINPPQTTTSSQFSGVYAFTPPTGSYTISVTASGYYPASNSTPVRFDGSRSVRIDACLFRYGTPSKVLGVTVLNGGLPVAGASVAAFNLSNPTGRPQLVTTNTTNAAGSTNLTLWSAQFLLRASAPDYQTDQSVDVSTQSTTTINLVAGPRLFGHVQDRSSGSFLGSGVVAWLYNPAASNSSAYKLIPAAVTGSFFDLHGPAGPYTLIVDADGHLSHEEGVTLGTTPNPHDVTLDASPQELYQTTIAYGANDWSNLTVWRNLTLNADSTLPGLVPANLRDLRLQIDATLGNGNGILDQSEITAFPTWLGAKGPGYVTTDAFLTTNGRAYNSSLASFTVTVSPTLGTSNAKVWINTTATYALKGTPPLIATGAKTYNVTLTMVPDSNTTAYQNYSYAIILPKHYELNQTTRVPSNAPMTFTGFTTVTVDPGVASGTPQARMTVSKSLVGMARAKVVAPIGKFNVVNANFTNYQAYVAGNTSMTFSGEDTYDPNGHAADANYTWN